MFQPQAYDLAIYASSGNSSGDGQVTIDGQEKIIAWATTGRGPDFQCDFRIDDQPVADPPDWTEPLDVVTTELSNHGVPDDEQEDWHARVKNGVVLWLIYRNRVLVGVLRPARDFGLPTHR